MAAVSLGEFTATVGPQLAADLRLANREAVNVCALEITTRARRALQAVIGPEQRLSGQRIAYTWSGADRKQGKADRRGIKINPYYKAADAPVHPTALVGVRGPAQRVEHPRKGGYPIGPTAGRPSRGAPSLEPLDISTMIDRSKQRVRAGEHLRRPALRMPDGSYRYGVKGGAITRPSAPITRTFRLAPVIVDRLAVDTMRKYMDLSLGKAS